MTLQRRFAHQISNSIHAQIAAATKPIAINAHQYQAMGVLS